jgi:DNA-binding MarR family transcriptional regulator
MAALDVDPLSPPEGAGDSNGSPPVTDFATQIAQQASERLTELDARSTSVVGQIEALRLEMDRIQREKAEAQRILDAALGTTDALQLARKADEPQGAKDEAPAAEAEAPAPSWPGGEWPEPQPAAAEAEAEEPVWTGGKWTTDERTQAILDEAARHWLTETTPSIFVVNDVKRALNVTRPTASGIVDRLQESGVIATHDEGRSFYVVTTAPAAEEPVEDAEEEAPAEQPEETDNAVTVERQSRRPQGQRLFTDEQFRDAICDIGEPFNARSLSDWMRENMGIDVAPVTLGKFIRGAHEAGKLKRTGGKGGPSVKYEYQPPDPRSGPRERPRHDGPRQLPKGTNGDRASGRGVAVAHTGRPVGRSGKPGRDKKKANLGFRVKDRKNK